MSQLDKIKKVIANKFIASDQNKLIEDKAPDGTRREIMVRKIPSEAGLSHVLYRFDPDKSDIFPFFEEVSHLRKICDYFLIVEKSDTIFCLLIEMKLGIDNNAKKQLEASHLFMDYLLKSAERISHKIQNYQIRKISISECKSRGKHTTKPKELEYDKNNYAEYNITGDFRLRPLLK